MGRKVLVVSDDDQVIRTVARILGEAGDAVTETFDYDGAISRVSAGPGAFDAIVTDLKLDPGRNGLQLALAARAIDPAIRIVIFTGMPMPDVYAAVRLSGVDKKSIAIVYRGSYDFAESLRKAVGA